MADAKLRRRSRAGATIGCFLLTLGMSLEQASAQQPSETFEVPAVEHVMTVRATIDAPIAMGKTPLGQRRVIAISGGTFEGPNLKGTIMPGGEDWQVVREDGVTELDARYALRTDDGAIIRVHNQVLLNPPAEGVAGAKQYLRSSVRFEAPIGKYDWLNKAIFVGTLAADVTQRPPVVTLGFFKVN